MNCYLGFQGLICFVFHLFWFSYSRGKSPKHKLQSFSKNQRLFHKMVRKLKFHEQKLLKKVDFINWEVDNNLHEVKVMKKYCIQKREDYTTYNKLSREIREIVRRIKDLVSLLRK